MENKPRPTEEEMWAGPSGERWLASALQFEAMLKPIGEKLIETAGLARGEHVIDVGCGAGSMSLEIAQRVLPGGSVTGLDISPGLVAEGNRKAAAAGRGEVVRFVRADAAKSGLPAGKADCLVSRFGVMFFTDPYGAFGHLHGLLRTGGRLALVCWAPVKENPWMLEMRMILGKHFELPMVPPRTPGPFAFDEPDYLRHILGKAGFGGIEIVPWKTELFVGGPGCDAPAATAFLFQALSMAQRAIDAPEEVREKVRTELCARLETFKTAGGVKMPGSVWVATGRA